MFIALHTRCFPSVCGKNFTGDSDGIRTHDLLLYIADVLTSRPLSLPDDDRPARILYSSGFRDIYRLIVCHPTQEFHQPISQQTRSCHHSFTQNSFAVKVMTV